MKLHRSARHSVGIKDIFAPGDSGLSLLGLSVLRLEQGGSTSFESKDREIAAVILSGTCDVDVNGASWTGLGERRDVFDGKATTVYIPPDATTQIRAVTDVTIALCSAPRGDVATEAYVVRPDEVVVNQRGHGAFAREVHDIIDASKPASYLVVGETFNQPGAWSSYPPHKHDVDAPPTEYKMEEIYLFRVNPAQGFGVQALYSNDPDRPLNEAHIVKDYDAVALPFGYHPVAAAPGYSLYYLWFLAGSSRTLVPHDDPAHAWVKGD